jgi:RanBP-type and C3HC4-type zinc finger-containing protein 1
VQFNEEAEVKCPYRDADYACNSVLQEREIKAVSAVGITV